MAFKGLKIDSRLKEKIKNSFTLVLTSFIILIAVVFMFVYYEVFLVLVPGYYEFDEYSKLVSKRNDLVDENNFLVSENVELVEKLNELGSTTKAFELKRDISTETKKNTNRALKNLDELLDVDDKILSLRLISKIKRYAELLSEVDTTSKSARSVELSISEARHDFYDFRMTESAFNECLGSIDRDSKNYSVENEKKIAATIQGCLPTLEEAKTKLNKLEKDLNTELPLMTQYLQNTTDFWNTSYNFHKSLGENNVGQAEKYNEQAAEYKRIISEMETNQVFEEFNDKILAKLIEDATELITKAEEQQADADEYYEKNLK